MPKSLLETQTCGNEVSLLAGIEGNEIKAGVILTAGQGVITRGSIIRQDGTGNYVKATAAPADTDRVAVLGTTVETGLDSSSGGILVDAFLSGLFNRAAISLGATTLTSAIEETLRRKGIFLDSVIPTSGPVPGADNINFVNLTAVASNGVSSTTNTTAIALVFRGVPTGLVVGNITITSGTGAATKGALTGSGTSWSLAVTTTTQGTIVVSIASPDGVTILGSPKIVTVYKAA